MVTTVAEVHRNRIATGEGSEAQPEAGKQNPNKERRVD
jgi:hypothetical protein